MKIIDFFKETEKRSFIDCRITSFCDYFRYYGLDVDPYDIFVLSQAFSMSCMYYRVGKVPFDMMLFSGTTFEFEHMVCLGDGGTIACCNGGDGSASASVSASLK